MCSSDLRERQKKTALDEETGLQEICMERASPIIEKIVDIVLDFKNSANKMVLAAWFQEDANAPLILEVLEILKKKKAVPSRVFKSVQRRCETEIKEKLQLEAIPEKDQDIKPNKWTLFRVNAHFRFYYLCKKKLQRQVIFENQTEARIIEESYLKPCPEGDLHIKDGVLAQLLQMKSMEIKEQRNQGVSRVLWVAFEDENTNLSGLCDTVLDCICASKLWKYQNRNISEALRIRQEICDCIREKEYAI